MGLIRLLIFVLVIWLIWRMIENYKVKQQQASSKGNKIPREQMVKCEYCSVHLPRADAFRKEDLWFCNEKHQRQFLDSGRD